LTFDLDLQNRPSEGPNTSLVWIWCKWVQQFPRYFIHKKPTDWRCQKQNLPQFTACGNESLKQWISMKKHLEMHVTHLMPLTKSNQQYHSIWFGSILI